MSSAQLYETIAVEIAEMDRNEMIHQLLHFPGRLRLDFSREYLAMCDTDRIRHLLLAARWRCQSSHAETAA